MKFSDLSLNISEPDYRQLPSLSYSFISKYKKENVLAFKDEKQEITPSLIFGSLVDMLLTQPEIKVYDKYTVIDKTIPKRAVKVLTDVKNGCELEVALMENYPSNWKLQTMKDKYIQEIGDFYNVGFDENKQIIYQEQLDDAYNIVNKISNNKSISRLFDSYYPKYLEGSEEIYYQLKFQTTLNNIPFKCMTDCICVDNKHKTITLYDLKTMSDHIWNFPNNFIKYNYWIQANLYVDIIKNIIKETPYANYEIKPFTFIVVNRYINEPCCVFQFNYSTPTDVKYNIKTYQQYANEILAVYNSDDFDLPIDFRCDIVELNKLLNYE